MKPFLFIACLLLISPWPAFAQTSRPAIAVTTDVEDGKKMVHALVTLNGKPIENVNLQYFVQRTFGNLPIGQDTTLDDGTSAVAFPTDLPGASDGNLHVIVRITAPPQYSSVSVSAAFGADVQPAPADPFPRALWAPNAPLALMLSIFVLLAGVWLSYLFVVSRILAIRNAGQQ
ncbi:MAG: hypothetical protein ABSC42_06440 [Tepidisphaeraceae bacterium]|jgi:hypothetical protein